MNPWQISGTVLGGGALLAFAMWLLKTAIKAWIASDAATFKINLKADADSKMAQFKTSLQLIATEHEVRFSKLHEKRAEIIAELYKKLTDVYWGGHHFVLTSENNPSPYQKKEFDEMTVKLRELFLYIEHHRIFLPESICTLLDEHFGQVNSIIYAAGIFGRIENANEHTAQQSSDSFDKAYEEFRTSIPAARKALENEFRRMLGVEVTRPPASEGTDAISPA